MALEPEDEIPANQTSAIPAKRNPGDVVFNVVFGVPWIAGAAWLEWDNARTWWVTAVLLSGIAFVGTGFIKVGNTDLPVLGLILLWLGFYVYGLVVADSVSLRVWLGVWLLDNFIVFGAVLPRAESPAPRREEPQDRVPDEA